ncbi:hypothetical protein K432DRAFT_210273 [Lepidopterella palustris CBS 459.81]|uniref:Ribosome biogenesis protein SLX9 n=1 Tax=Lepidopterella palustris CBS 459.81 TaxID=1314670 RepID=A0A8E2DYP9_9PEZI|nr:hypothetical protein K432DRAFT_210273 [Lepidopterella palustris CBS 459.81]
MAPTPGKRPQVRAKSTKSTRPRPSYQSSDAALFPSTKKDKRTIKHSIFIHRIEKASSNTKKRTRPNKKLIANLESLADALPELEDIKEKGEIVVGQAEIRHKSLKSRPGAMKRKEKLENMEKERFNKNLAQLAGSTQGQDNGAEHTTIANRWAALKSFVQSTVQRKPEIVNT